MVLQDAVASVGVLWLLYGGMMPLVRGRPWISSSRLEAGSLLAALVVGLVVEIGLGWSAWQARGVVAPWEFIAFNFSFGLVFVVLIWRRGSVVRGVSEEDFRRGLEAMLRLGDYAFELRVGGNGRLSAIDLHGLWSGVELAVRWEAGTGTLRSRDESGGVVIRGILERMPTYFEHENVEPSRRSSLLKTAGALLVAVVYLALR